MNQAIYDAIQDKKIITFYYADERGSLLKRVAEPYAYGLTRQGNEAIRCYQTGGSSETVIPGWKLFLVDRMSRLVVGEQTFDACAPGYAHGDKGLKPLFCCVT